MGQDYIEPVNLPPTKKVMRPKVETYLVTSSMGLWIRNPNCEPMQFENANQYTTYVVKKIITEFETKVTLGRYVHFDDSPKKQFHGRCMQTTYSNTDGEDVLNLRKFQVLLVHQDDIDADLQDLLRTATRKENDPKYQKLLRIAEYASAEINMIELSRSLLIENYQNAVAMNDIESKAVVRNQIYVDSGVTASHTKSQSNFRKCLPITKTHSFLRLHSTASNEEEPLWISLKILLFQVRYHNIQDWIGSLENYSKDVPEDLVTCANNGF